MTASNQEVPLADTIASLLDSLGGRTAIAASHIATQSSRALPVVGSPLSDDHEDHDAPEAAESVMPQAVSSASVLLRETDILPAASLAKLPIAVELLRRADLGQFDLAERFDTSVEPRAGGGGVLDYLHPSTQLTLRELCLLMIAVSDNTAANFLLDLVGMGEVNETASRLNVTHTKLSRRFMDFAARAAHRDNVTAAADMHALLSLVRSGALPGAQHLREMLAAQRLGEDLMLRLPESAQLAHKTGTLSDVFHDAGILSGPAGVCVYCVLTADQPDMPAARAVVGAVVRTLWDAWCAG
jgi:beta-lactamase class A